VGSSKLPDSEVYEVAIVGAGPAGLGAATRAAHRGMKHILLERQEIGNTIFNYQARKHVMAEPQKLPLRSHVVFEATTRERVLELWNKAVHEHKVNVVKADVTQIQKSGEVFTLLASGQEIRAKKVVLCIGVQGTPNKLKVPGEELPHVAYSLSDPDAFEGKHIMVVGAGDAAIENALALCDKNKVSLLNLSDDFPRAKEANAAKIQQAIKNGQIKMYAHSSCLKIEQQTLTLHTPEGDITVPCDHLIIRIGGSLPRKFLESIGVQFPSADLFAVPRVNQFYESNVSGLYLLGALIGYPLIKQALNQGYEVIEIIAGSPLDPADQPLIDEALKIYPGEPHTKLRNLKNSLPLFSDLSESQFRELVIESKLHSMTCGQTVFERNDYTDTFFSIISGSVSIDLDDGRQITIPDGQFFGEMGLVSGRRRVATVKVSSDALLLETPRRQMLKLMKSVPSVKTTLDELFVLRALQSTVFPKVDAEFLQTLVKRVKLKSFKKNEFLFKEGDVGDALYVIRKGSVKISRLNTKGQSITLTYCPVGHIVGEMSLLGPEGSLRSASVSAAVACDAIVIARADFLEVLNRSPETKSIIEALASSRKLENIQSENQSLESSALLDFMMSHGVSDADNVLTIDSNLCIGCDQCEKACAATHGGHSRLDRKGGKSFASIQIPVSCRHCENPLCMTDCPPDALVRQPNGEVLIKDSCIGCGNCVSNCPYEVIQLVHELEEDRTPLLFKFLGFGSEPKEKSGPAKAAKCDLCHDLKGGPACVRICPTGAAIRMKPQDLIQRLKEKN
jgi:thioredoxin reductase/Fe-S-cluster-containing hydrogenase component 2/CRP-like cAMP-binding protein